MLDYVEIVCRRQTLKLIGSMNRKVKSLEASKIFTLPFILPYSKLERLSPANIFNLV
jgi:hypothetical protein